MKRTGGCLSESKHGASRQDSAEVNAAKCMCGTGSGCMRSVLGNIYCGISTKILRGTVCKTKKTYSTVTPMTAFCKVPPARKRRACTVVVQRRERLPSGTDGSVLRVFCTTQSTPGRTKPLVIPKRTPRHKGLAGRVARVSVCALFDRLCVEFGDVENTVVIARNLRALVRQHSPGFGQRNGRGDYVSWENVRNS